MTDIENSMVAGATEDYEQQFEQEAEPYSFTAEDVIQILWRERHISDAFGQDAVPQGEFSSHRAASTDFEVDLCASLYLIQKHRDEKDEASLRSQQRLLGERVGDLMINYAERVHKDQQA